MAGYDDFNENTASKVNRELSSGLKGNAEKLDDAWSNAAVRLIENFTNLVAGKFGTLLAVVIILTLVLVALTILVWLVMIAWFSTVDGYSEGVTILPWISDGFKSNISAYEAQKILTYPFSFGFGYWIAKRM